MRYVFYNSETGYIYSVKNYTKMSHAEQNCAANARFNMTCKPESVIGAVDNPNNFRVNVSVDPHVVESKPGIQPVPFCEECRTMRNYRLSKSDWTQAADSPLSPTLKAQWATYRQALRDMDIDSCHCWDDVVWPTTPSLK